MRRRGLKVRIYPTKAQRILFLRTFGCVRLLYNKGLVLRKKAYKAGCPVGFKETSLMLTELKKLPEYAFLLEVDSMALQQVLRDLERAYKNFFEKRARDPKFKSKHHSKQSYRTNNQKGSIRIVGRYIRLPKIGLVKTKQFIPEDVCIHHATVECSKTGKFYVVLNIDVNETLPSAKEEDPVGLDLGIKNYYTDHNGNKQENPALLEQKLKKLRRVSRRFSKTQKGSKNHEKMRRKLARVHEQVADARNDFQHKLSTRLANTYQTICVEDLDIKGMLKKAPKRIARRVHDAAWGSFVRMLEYKVMERGGSFVKVPRDYASSQRCSCCGYKNAAVKDLRVRKWDCPVCGTHHDRDVNAAINIRQKGLSMLAS